jgi:ribonuclease-3
MDKNYLIELIESFGLKPSSFSNYLIAFTHNSYQFENSLKYNYQKLEFLGDAILYKITTDYLFNNYDYSEGELSKMRAVMIQSISLAKAAKELKFEKLIMVGQSIIKEYGQNYPDNIFADCFEAFLAAIYLDLGEESAKIVVNKTIIKLYISNNLEEAKDFKSIVYEYVEGKLGMNVNFIQIENGNLFTTDV